ncbi:MAG: hypothetical protein H0X37_13745 [Herpetosiphonaceae bacterium]|nr:hypothetical protein [Herpetosiphonaceae bacterium]
MALLPRSFIGIGHRLCLDSALDLAVDRRQGRTNRLIQRWHTAQAQRNAPQVVEQQHYLAGTHPIAAMQQGDQRHHLWPKSARRQVRRALSAHGVVTLWTIDDRELVLLLDRPVL